MVQVSYEQPIRHPVARLVFVLAVRLEFAVVEAEVEGEVEHEPVEVAVLEPGDFEVLQECQIALAEFRIVLVE